MSNNGLFIKTQEAKANYLAAQADENTKLEGYESILDEYLDVSTVKNRTYEVGEEISFRGEQFFVIADNGNTVNLLAKYCLNEEGTAQINEYWTNYEIFNFSDSYYWRYDFTSNPFDLIAYTTDEVATNNSLTESNNVILKAKKYGLSKNVTGRLLHYNECKQILDSNNERMKVILLGTWSGEDQCRYLNEPWLHYWIGDAYDQLHVYIIDGNYTKDQLHYGNVNSPGKGVRPVLEVTKE